MIERAEKGFVPVRQARGLRIWRLIEDSQNTGRIAQVRIPGDVRQSNHSGIVDELPEFDWLRVGRINDHKRQREGKHIVPFDMRGKVLVANRKVVVIKADAPAVTLQADWYPVACEWPRVMPHTHGLRL